MEVTLNISSPDELTAAISSNTDPSASYDVTVTYFMSQEDIKKLADSQVGQNATEISINPEYDDHSPEIDYSLVSFPQLSSLDINYQNMKAIHFTQDNTPKLTSLRIEQVTDEIEYFHTDLPELECMGFEFITLSDSRGFGKSLSRSPKLTSLTCYKFWGLGDTKKNNHLLVLPNCEFLNFYRSDDLCYLKIWAPKLIDLNLQACYAIREVNIIDQIPREYKTKGEEYNFNGTPSPYTVNFINTTIAKGNVTTHARCSRVHENMNEMDMF